ncbi:MAG TPA: prephenate dehydrogenase/arogenate dehydrogenase family protein [Patescibacteria group bacterium]|nr:prephenate dehydrogenase/arogenate dehydrogenase family protein [Patescibacteria group bacterium]
MKKISIVGFGRFGKVLYRLVKDDFVVTVYTRKPINSGTEISPNTVLTNSIQDIYKSDVIFFAVPIDAFESVIKAHKKYFIPGHLLIDVLSVKLHPRSVFEKHLKGSKTQVLLTHPMFGPDSSRNGFDGLPIIMDRFKADETNYVFWKNYFTNKHLHVIEMSARDHDRLAANSQGLTHFVGRLLDSYGLRPTQIDSLGTKKLLEVIDQTCNDSWQLFTNLQHFNPYTKRMRMELGDTYDRLYNKLLPKQHNPHYITFGIQGGKGSFNEQAIHDYVEKEEIKHYRIKYLYTTAAVMRALHTGEIDFGQFAIHNSVGGIVGESINAMADYRFTIVKEFAIKISHALMIRKDATLEDATTIMTHPQVLAQCKATLARKYPQLAQTSGTGILLDHAVVARQLGCGKLPKEIATMGSRILATLYGLKIVEVNLEDAKENFTIFLIVTRT